MSEFVRNARILIVDDEDANVRVLSRTLQQAGYEHIWSTCDSREARALYIRHRPDLILLDLHMPHLDGYEVMEQLGEIAEATYLPILVLTADIDREAKQRALSMGAKDFVYKPFDPIEVRLRIRTLLETRFLYLRIQAQNHILEAKVQERTRALEDAQIEIIERLAMAAEFRDDNTGQHTKRVGQTAALVAQQLGWSDMQVTLIRRAAPLHDVGKIGIPDQILMKPGRLTPDEFDVIKTHTAIGARILSGSRFPLLQMAEQIALSHHERWDGEGYTPGLRHDAIPLPGRIVAVADVFDALTQQRPYKPAWPLLEAIAEVDRQRGQQFDPQVAEAFLRVMEASRTSVAP
ncbi:MAG TPA: HD domain-containing phosphohydrolase [Vicinamibacterales bacterium]|nr:HD domain-containing phosphohydrolase [Vicinamibacterales bacterium]